MPSGTLLHLSEFPWTGWKRRIQVTSTFKEALWASPGQVLWKQKSTSQAADVVFATRMCAPAIRNWHSPFGTEEGTEMFAPLTQSASARTVVTRREFRLETKSYMLEDVRGHSNYNTPNCEPRPNIEQLVDCSEKDSSDSWPSTILSRTMSSLYSPTGTSLCQNVLPSH